MDRRRKMRAFDSRWRLIDLFLHTTFASLSFSLIAWAGLQRRNDTSCPSPFLDIAHSLSLFSMMFVLVRADSMLLTRNQRRRSYKYRPNHSTESRLLEFISGKSLYADIHARAWDASVHRFSPVVL
ncbi:hypothetical protein F4779DRAFT_427595 [Xylariaceae sp. FL0662B]|nr:hypothetical protein F4779DRAFT_427595 [Xylariaceae sp. FL0662B]